MQYWKCTALFRKAKMIEINALKHLAKYTSAIVWDSLPKMFILSIVSISAKKYKSKLIGKHFMMTCNSTMNASWKKTNIGIKSLKVFRVLLMTLLKMMNNRKTPKVQIAFGVFCLIAKRQFSFLGINLFL